MNIKFLWWEALHELAAELQGFDNNEISDIIKTFTVTNELFDVAVNVS